MYDINDLMICVSIAFARDLRLPFVFLIGVLELSGGLDFLEFCFHLTDTICL